MLSSLWTWGVIMVGLGLFAILVPIGGPRNDAWRRGVVTGLGLALIARAAVGFLAMMTGGG
jgi:hypothetical protein